MRLLVCVACLLLLAALPARAAPPPWLSDPGRLTFEGVETFTAEQIVAALRWDPEYQSVAHPSAPSEAYLEAVHERVTAGYRHGGFPHAKVDARADTLAEKVVVSVVEGPRYTAGEVRVVGAKTIDAAALVRRLTEPQPPVGQQAPPGGTGPDVSQPSKKPKAPAWSPGKPARLDGGTIGPIRNIVKETVKDQGYFFAQFSVQIEPDPQKRTAALLVKITDEGPPGVLGEITVRGAKRNTPEQVLAYLSVKPGQKFDRQVLWQAEQRLRDSGRFVRCKLTPKAPEKEGQRVRLAIALEELEGVPALDKDFSPEEKTLLKFRQWLEEFLAGDEELTLSAAAEEQTYGMDRLEAAFSPRRGLVALGRASRPEGEPVLRYALAATTGQVGFYSAARGHKLTLPADEQRLLVTLSIVPIEEPKDPEYKFTFKFGVGLRSRDPGEESAPVQPQVDLAPAALLDVAHRNKASCAIHDGVLVIRRKQDDGELEMKIDAQSGRLLGVTGSGDGVTFQIRIGRGGLDRLLGEIGQATAGHAEGFEAERPLGSLLCYGIEELLWWSRQADPKAAVQQEATAKVVRKLLVGGILAPLERLFTQQASLESTGDNDSEFTIPHAYRKRLAESLLDDPRAAVGLIAPRVMDELFPRGSWPWTLGREAGFVVAGRDKYTMVELARIYDSDQTGPIGYLAVARAATMVDSRIARLFASKGLKRLSADDFRKDYRLLLLEDGPLVEVLTAVSGALRGLDEDEVKVLGGMLDPPYRGILKSWVEELEKDPNKPATEVLSELLDRYWKDVLRPAVEAQLKTLTQEGEVEVL